MEPTLDRLASALSQLLHGEAEKPGQRERIAESVVTRGSGPLLEDVSGPSSTGRGLEVPVGQSQSISKSPERVVKPQSGAVGDSAKMSSSDARDALDRTDSSSAAQPRLVPRWKLGSGSASGEIDRSHVPSQDEVKKALVGAFAQISAKIAQGGYGMWYVNDPNSRRVFSVIRSSFGPAAEPVMREVLAALTEDVEPMVRWKAVRLLLYMGTDDADLMRRYWMNEPDRILREIVIEAANQLPKEKSFALMSDLAQADDDDHIRSQAFNKLLEGAGADYPQYVIPAIESSLSDKDEYIRARALVAAANIDAEYALELARHAMSRGGSNSELVSATEVLSKHGSLDELTKLADAYSRNRFNEYVYCEAIKRFVERFGNEAVRDHTTKLQDKMSRDAADKVVSPESN